MDGSGLARSGLHRKLIYGLPYDGVRFPSESAARFISISLSSRWVISSSSCMICESVVMPVGYRSLGPHGWAYLPTAKPCPECAPVKL